MGKDPAFLFYPGDYLGGTMGWDFSRHGMYLIMLIYQFNNGHFSLDNAISICGSSFDDIKVKFKLDENGLFFNERLDYEINKRSKYSESRRENIKKRYEKSTYVEHMNNTCSTYDLHMENRNENENINDTGNETDIKQPTESERIFDEFRKKYPGSKRGLKTEYENFRKRHRDHSTVLPMLLPALDNQSSWRLEMSRRGEFVPQWKNLQTWINQRCWEEEQGQLVCRKKETIEEQMERLKREGRI